MHLGQGLVTVWTWAKNWPLTYHSFISIVFMNRIRKFELKFLKDPQTIDMLIGFPSNCGRTSFCNIKGALYRTFLLNTGRDVLI